MRLQTRSGHCVGYAGRCSRHRADGGGGRRRGAGGGGGCRPARVRFAAQAAPQAARGEREHLAAQ
eukprot:2972603-Prymnesium_polylepis.1